MPTDSFDLVVIGAGTGGYAAAFRAAQLGRRVALIDEDKVGGTCLHRGCIPTKVLLQTADWLAVARDAKEYGLRLTLEGDGLDYATLTKRKERIVRQLHKGVEYLIKKNEVAFYAGRGRLVDRSGASVRVAVAGNATEQEIMAKDVLLATGSRPRALPGLAFDGQRILSSDDALLLAEPPKSALILGAGAIGVEFASLWNDFGVHVTLIEAAPRLVPLEDEEVSTELAKIFAKRGIRLFTGAKLDPGKCSVSEEGVVASVTAADGEEHQLTAEVLLVAIGRTGNVDDLGLDALGVQHDRGLIQVDAHYRTTAPHVYAIGDVIGGYLLAHVAAHEGLAAVAAMAGEAHEPLDALRIPRATYCRPQIASIGYTEAECTDRGWPVKVGRFPFRANGKALIGGEAEGFAKVIAHAESDQLLGVHLIGPHVTDLIAEPALAAFLQGTAWELGESIHPHPTLTEVLGEAALAVTGHAIHV